MKIVTCVVKAALLLPEVYSLFLVASWACYVRRHGSHSSFKDVGILNDASLLSLLMPREKKLPFFFQTLFRVLLKIKVAFYF